MTSLALSMIVRDAAATLRQCLESVRGIADEIVIGDTGSADSTLEIARELGARIIEIPWANDFSAARNAVLAEVRCNWVLSLDADEILDPEAGKSLRKLLGESAAAGYQVSIRNYVLSLEDRIWDRPAKPNDFRLPAAKAYPAYVDHANVRLFRRDPRIYFVGRVHESVGPRIEELGMRLGHAEFLIHHFGLAADAGTRARKNIFYRELGRLKISEMPDNAQAYLELGLVELDNFGNLQEALALFERACELNPRLGVAWFFAGLVKVKTGNYDDALRCLKQAEESGHGTSVVAETTGDAHYNQARFSQALDAYKKALKLSPDSSLLESKLGLAIIRNGSMEQGLKRIRRSVEQQPHLGELHDRLILSLVWLERTKEAALAAEGKLRAVRSLVPMDFLRAATLWTKQNNWARAAAVLHVGLQVFPGDALMEQASHEICVQEGTRAEELMASLKMQEQRTFRN
jgi:tetratricopeptide (TPR) repeat protein